MAAVSETHWWYCATRVLLEELIDPHLPRPDEATVYLDAAGGVGATGSWLAERATTVLDDIEPEALTVAERRWPGYRAVRSDINHLPHPNDVFDASLCVTALYHEFVTDPASVVAELARVTKPGGLVCLMEPGVRRLRRGHDVVTHNARRFSVGDMRELIVGADLELIRATGAYSFLVPPAAVLALVERGEPQSDVGRNESGLGGLFGALATAERGLLRRVDLPAGLSVLALGRKRRVVPSGSD